MTPDQHGIDKQLLSRLTHHIRNPFNGIIGFSDLLNHHFEKLHAEDVKNYVQIIHHLSKKALLRSENLSWWLKSYTNNVHPIIHHINLNEIVKEELNYFNSEITKQELEIELQEGAESLMVNVDKVMLQNIIKNILLNIVEFTTPIELVTVQLKKTKNSSSVIFTNPFKEKVSPETLTYIQNLNTSKVDILQMPDHAGIWVMHLLCSTQNIKLDISANNGTFIVTLNFQNN
jgi:signal transduction histidine kinase